MRLWPWALGGMAIWAAHFFALYALGSVFETSAVARIGTLIATLLALAANLWLFLSAGNADGDALTTWMKGLAQAGALLSAVAVIWQGLVALLI